MRLTYFLGLCCLLASRALAQTGPVDNLPGDPLTAGPKLPRTNAALAGEIYLDLNYNSQHDAFEPAFPRPLVLTEAYRDLTTTVVPGSAIFTMPVDSGTFFLSMPQPPAYYSLSEGASGYYGTVRGGTQTISGNQFGLVPTPGQQDLRVTLTPYAPARPGRLTRYRVRLENVGTEPVPYGEVSVTLPSAATIIGAVPASGHGQGQTRSWMFQNLPPFGVRDYDITGSLPVTTTAGTSLLSTATATAFTGTELTPADNVDSLQQVVVASFDPNDITVNHTELSLSQLANSTALDYLIRFENLGTDTAFAVTIVDSLPASRLLLGTLKLVGASHNVEVMVSSRGVLTLRFPGIQLPYRNIDALRSQGFVRFRVVPRSTLVPGTIIPGAAHIYFDVNPPVSTNRVTTIIAGAPAGLADSPVTDATWALFPNPTDATVGAELAAMAPAAGEATVRVLDALGRVVQTSATAVGPGAVRLPVATTTLIPGIYVVELQLPGRQAARQRLLIQ